MRVTFRCDPALLGLLPPPVPARSVLPGWLRDMDGHALSDMHGGPVRTVKHCPPFIDAMSHGFVIPLPCDVQVEAGRLSWNWDLPPLAAATHPRAPLSFHVPAQVAGTPFARPDQVVVKFNAFWTIRLEPGWSLFVTHPVNRDDLPFRLLTGLVDADRFNEVGILFPAIWSDPDFTGTLPRGMPVAHCVPVPREPIELDIGAMEPADVQRYDALGHTLLDGTGHYRRTLRAPRSHGGTASGENGAQPPGLEEQQS